MSAPQRTHEAAVEQAISDGKLAPSSKDYYLSLCRSEGGFEKFETFVASLPARRREPEPVAAQPELERMVDPVEMAKAAADYQAERAAAGYDPIDIATAVRAITGDAARMAALPKLEVQPALASNAGSERGRNDSITDPAKVARDAALYQKQCADTDMPVNLPTAVLAVTDKNALTRDGSIDPAVLARVAASHQKTLAEAGVNIDLAAAVQAVLER